MLDHKFAGIILKIHLCLCVVAVFYYFDLMSSESFYGEEKERLKSEAVRNIGTGNSYHIYRTENQLPFLHSSKNTKKQVYSIHAHFWHISFEYICKANVQNL